MRLWLTHSKLAHTALVFRLVSVLALLCVPTVVFLSFLAATLIYAILLYMCILVSTFNPFQKCWVEIINTISIFIWSLEVGKHLGDCQSY